MVLYPWRWIVALSICTSCWVSLSVSASYSSNGSNSPLWRQEFHYTDESPNSGNKSRRPSGPQQGRSTLFNGGSSSASASPQQLEGDPRVPEKLIQCRKKFGKFMVDLGEPKASRQQQKAKIIRPSFGSRRVLRLSAFPQSRNATISNSATGQISTVDQQSLDPYENPIEMSLSIDIFSAFRLLHNFAGASVGAFAAFWGTLRMLAPMIVARRCLAFLAYAGFDHYNGRYLRRTYNKRIEVIQRLEIHSGFRAAVRATIQLLAMGTIGRLSRAMLASAPCWMPDRICKYWFGMVWTLSVIAAARITELWMTLKVPFLGIQPAASRHTRPSPLQIFLRPWHILQWMRDPEESISRMFKSGYRDGPLPFHADSLLYPSTWPPLQVLTSLAMIHAIQMTLPSPPKAMLRSFCIQSVLYEEWYRILFKERRVVLGAVASILSFLATVTFVHTAAAVDGVAGVLLTPGILASLVAGWMNLVLCNERIGTRKKRSNTPPARRTPAIYAIDNLDGHWHEEHIMDTKG